MSAETPVRLDLEHPPLVEQAIVAVFDPVERFSIVDYGLFWSEIAEQFPDVEAADPVASQLESFDEFKPLDVTFQLLAALPMPRAMLRNSQAGEAIQMQADRFGFNWSKVEGGDYPHSEPVMARFDDLFGRFLAFVDRRGLGAVTLRQAELTNLNIIPLEEFGTRFSDMGNALKIDPLDFELPCLENETYSRARQHRIVGDNGAPVGRLHTAIQPVISKQDGSKALRVEFTARSAPTITSLDEMRHFFAIGRNVINGAFRATTTDSMREKWGERHG